MKIKSEFIHIGLSTFISVSIVFFPLLLSKELMWVNYTDTNKLTTVGYAVTWVWLIVVYCCVFSTVYNFLNSNFRFKNHSTKSITICVTVENSKIN